MGILRKKMIRIIDLCAIFILLMAIRLELFSLDKQGVLFSEARMEAEFEKCCGLGTSWALEGLKCEKFTGPVSGVPTVEQGLCLEAVDICCIRTYHEEQCKKGKLDAHAGLACVSDTKSKHSGPGDYHRDCCEACKLGILTGSMGQGCAFKKFTFGNPWDPAFLECCHEVSPSTSAPTDFTNVTLFNETTDTSSSSISTSLLSTPTLASTSSSLSIPTPPLDDICQLMKGLLCSDICVPTPGSYYCKCREGFSLLEDGKTCRQDLPIDRCKLSNPCEQRCTDNGVAVTCSCNSGYILAKDKHSCLPKSFENKSTISEDDEFLPLCPIGYRYNATNQVCDDIDECAEGLDSCEGEVCYNQPGGYSCATPPKPKTRKPPTTPSPTLPNKKCASGLKFVKNYCVDINECREIDDACSSNEDCINTVGSYTCKCKIGFRRENLTQACVDINECQTREDICLQGQRCDNTIGSYTCTRFLSCGTGYTLNAATGICEDDDECLLGLHDCRSGYQCKNTLGSFRCYRNPRTPVSQARVDTTTPLTTTTSQSTSTFRSVTSTSLTTEKMYNCPHGFELGSGGKCVDIDECQEDSSICGRTMRCMNTVGSYRCVSKVICSNGFTLDPISGQYCIDIDECANGTHECTPDQTCENRLGGYVCTCPPGHVAGLNKDCVDIDECSLYGNICGSNSRCENTVGSFRCNCESGFENIGGFAGGSCQDIDECQRTPNLCQHMCFNVWGSYRCACKPGFRLNSDNRSCTDVDECTEFKKNNLCIGICENTPGSYACKCPDGYKLGFNGRTCEDIDECQVENVCRGADEICHNTRGGFRCNKINCPTGYHRDHERKNRCVKSWPCRINDPACLRQPSHYSYNFITLVSMLPIAPNRPEELFKMKGYHMPGSTIQFSMTFLEARAPPGVQRATESCFALKRPAPQQAVLTMTRSIQGPQEIELDLSMEVYHNTFFAGSAVAKILIFVSQYEF